MTIFATSRRVLSAGHLRVHPRGAVCQVRWESKVAGEDQTKKADRDAALLFMRKRKQAEQAEASDRQTVRPDIPASTRKARDTQAAEQSTPQAQSQVDRIAQLSADEEARLDDMRAAQGEIREVLDGVLRQFSAPIRYAFAYGSGVYKQAGYGAASKPMVDLIFGVSHPDHWHALNIAQHRSHYSFMGALGANAVTYVQERMGAGVYYNPFVEVQGVVVKYGVVSMDTLSSDLLNWDSLYLAGRMHKPTLTLRRDPLMRISKQVNLAHAVRAALLMLPKQFTPEELFARIAGLSFAGDVRMRVGGENPRKVQNIVEAQLPLFKSRYSSIIEGLPNVEYVAHGVLQQNMAPHARAAMLRKMPNNFYDRLIRQGRKAGIRLPPGLGAERVNTERLVDVDEIAQIATKAVESIVAWPALTQSLKGVLSSGVSKSISYMYAKNSKYRAEK